MPPPQPNNFSNLFATAHNYGRRLSPRQTNFRTAFHPEHSTALLRNPVTSEADAFREQVTSSSTAAEAPASEQSPTAGRLRPVLPQIGRQAHKKSQNLQSTRGGSRGLLWKIVCGKVVSSKATLRNWARRRLREAFREALRDRGFDFQGLHTEVEREPRSFSVGGRRDMGRGNMGKGDMGKGGRDRDLSGSLVLSCFVNVLKASHEELRRDALVLVDGLSSATWFKKSRDNGMENDGRKGARRDSRNSKPSYRL